MKPLVVYLRLGSPMAYPYRKRAYPLHLDALVVALLAAREGRLPGQRYDPAGDIYSPDRWPDNGVPLAVAGARRKVYRASALEFPADASWCWQYGWVKKLPDEDLARWADYGRRRVDACAPKKGEFRPWRDHLCCAVAPVVRFFCVGDRGALEELLPLVEGGGVGVRRSAGLGEVLEVGVEESDFDWSLVDSGGRPARARPVEDGPDGEARGWQREWWASRSPYWAVANRGWCWVPPVDRYYPLRGMDPPVPEKEPAGRKRSSRAAGGDR